MRPALLPVLVQASPRPHDRQWHQFRCNPLLSGSREWVRYRTLPQSHNEKTTGPRGRRDGSHLPTHNGWFGRYGRFGRYDWLGRNACFGHHGWFGCWFSHQPVSDAGKRGADQIPPRKTSVVLPANRPLSNLWLTQPPTLHPKLAETVGEGNE